MSKSQVWSIGLLGLLAVFMVGCNDVQRFNERMKLNESEALQAKPILEAYLSKQEALFTELQKQRPTPSQGQGGMGGPGMGQPGMVRGGSDSKRPDTGVAKETMTAMNKPFEANDAAAAKDLSGFLSPEQVEAFNVQAKAYRQEKMKEFMDAHRPSGGGPGGGQGSGPMGGGMGMGHGGVNF